MPDDQYQLNLYLRHRRDLIDYAAGILGCRSRAEDVVQDAYLRLSARTDRQPLTQPIGYFFRIVRNLAFDVSRRIALEHRVFDVGPPPASTVEDRPSPEEEAVHREELQVVLNALAELPERTRLALEMHRFGGYQLRQIAERLGISTTLAHSLIHEALAHCQARLRERQ